MNFRLDRRMFLRLSAAGAALYTSGIGLTPTIFAAAEGSPLVSPGCRGTKVRVARLYMGIPKAHWPEPTLNLDDEVKRYEAEFAKRAKSFADIDFAVSELVTTPEQAQQIASKLGDVDGVLVIHLSMGIPSMLKPVLAAGKPTVLFAAPYSGHEWTGFGGLERSPEGALLECMLTSDFDQLAAAVRPFRAIHHLREAKILNVSARTPDAEFLKGIKDKFGSEIVTLDKEPVLAAFNAVPDAEAEAEAKRWIDGAQKVVEPSRDEIFRSCKLALAFEKLLTDANATAITVDCYGSMYRQLPAFPCIGFTRLNDKGLAGICESDLQSALTFIMLQSLTGKPGFISDPTVDESTESIILAHCLGSTKMDGPEGEACPYRLRCIMERQEGAVGQVFMPVKRKVTQAELIGMDKLLYFTGDVIDAPDTDRGCRTKINVKVDGDIRTLWQNWSHGLHRVTVYADARTDLRRFCRFKGIEMFDEARA
jgi:L-arabinose isomerase